MCLFKSERHLKSKNTFYSISRRDVEYSELEKIGFDKWREFRDKMDIEVPAIYYPAKITPNDNYSLINCCGDFQFAHKDVWHKIKGYEEKMIYACFQDTNIQKKAVLNGYDLEYINKCLLKIIETLYFQYNLN